MTPMNPAIFDATMIIQYHIQASGCFADSKDAADLIPRGLQPLDDVLKALEDAFTAEGAGDVAGPPLPAERMAAFVREHFSAPADGPHPAMRSARPPGFGGDGMSRFLAQLPDGPPRGATAALCSVWPLLFCEPAPEAAPLLHGDTLVPPPGPVVVPGQRFREWYYWDSLWSARGLRAAGMPEAATAVARTMLQVADARGFVLNGARTNYLSRSQPPVLAVLAADTLCDGGGDAEGSGLVDLAARALAKEAAFWSSAPRGLELMPNADGAPWHVRLADHAPGGAAKTSTAIMALSRYCAGSRVPRPESFREDMALALEMVGAAAVGEGMRALGRWPARAAAEVLGRPAVQGLMAEVATAAESGWDFSSRWMVGEARADAPAWWLGCTAARRVVPVDLNVLVARLEWTAGLFRGMAGDGAGAAEWVGRAQRRVAAIHEAMWDAGAGRWRDLVMDGDLGDTGEAGEGGRVVGARRREGVEVYASDWMPLWLLCCPAIPGEAPLAEPGDPRFVAAAASLRASDLWGPGGVAASNIKTGQQWDFPNAWPPLQSVLVEALEALGRADLASELACNVLASMAAGMKRDECCRVVRPGTLFEKYRSDRRGSPGGGGEYPPQVGFGWSVGVALELLAKQGLWAEREEDVFEVP